MIKLFKQLQDAESQLAAAQKNKKETVLKLDNIIRAAKNKVMEVEELIAKEMRDNGVLEETIEGKTGNYKIYFQKPFHSVAGDADAAPDEFIRIKRELDKKKVAEHLKSLQAAGKQLPNWASFQLGESKLTWKFVKK